MNLLDLPLEVLRQCFGVVGSCLAFRSTCRGCVNITGDFDVQLLARYGSGRQVPISPGTHYGVIMEYSLVVDGVIIGTSFGASLYVLMRLYAVCARAAGYSEIIWCLTVYSQTIARAAQKIKHTRQEYVTEVYGLYVAPADVLAGECWLPDDYSDAIW